MPRPTKKDLRAKLKALKTDNAASTELKAMATKFSDDDRQVGGKDATTDAKLTRFNAYLAQNDANLDLKTVQQIVSWFRRHVVEGDDKNAPQALKVKIAAMKARLVALETSGTAPEGTNEFVEQILERDVHIGHDDDTALSRLDTELAKGAGSIKTAKLDRLMTRAKNIWPELDDE